MKHLFYFSAVMFIHVLMSSCRQTTSTTEDTQTTNEPFRPIYHFTPDSMWMNDPNGMVFHHGEYHLFYQHFPNDTKWGPMHWGHAVSKDLAHWEHLPIALYPDSLGYIFSGSAVEDTKNTSGLGTENNPPLIAIFTYHDPVKAEAGADDFQTQGMAYSTDHGATWTKYPQNPVLKNPGIRDFRDPKVFWHEETNQWKMILAVQDHVSIYSSADLKTWIFESDFGKQAGAHGGVWECPDLFPLNIDGEEDKQKWVLLLSINPGGPNGGSATQYFVGDFDGKVFSTEQHETKWIDYGTDNYAGVTWSGTGKRKIFLGWMSNWSYAEHVPTKRWRSAMTTPRELKLISENNDVRLVGFPVRELDALKGHTQSGKSDELELNSACWLTLSVPKGAKGVVLSNENNEKVTIGWNESESIFYVDRTMSGITDFSSDFAKRIEAPFSLGNHQEIKLDILIDESSVEVFVNEGLLQMTVLVFPTTPYQRLNLLDDTMEATGTLSEIKETW